MKHALQLLRQQSVILVDIFATSFLFIFLAFLTQFVRYQMSLEADSSANGSSGLRLVGGAPFTYERIVNGLRQHEANWRSGSWVELYADRLKVYTRSYRDPRTVSFEPETPPRQELARFFDTVQKDAERFGPAAPYASTSSKPNPDRRPHINLLIFNQNLYYAVRDEVQRRRFHWAEFIVPVMPSPSSIPAAGVGGGAGGSAPNIDEVSHAAVAPGQPPEARVLPPSGLPAQGSDARPASETPAGHRPAAEARPRQRPEAAPPADAQTQNGGEPAAATGQNADGVAASSRGAAGSEQSPAAQNVPPAQDTAQGPAREEQQARQGAEQAPPGQAPRTGQQQWSQIIQDVERFNEQTKARARADSGTRQLEPSKIDRDALVQSLTGPPVQLRVISRLDLLAMLASLLFAVLAIEYRRLLPTPTTASRSADGTDSRVE